MSEGQEALRGEFALLGERLDQLERRQSSSLQKLEQRQGAALEALGQSSDAAATRQERRLRLLFYAAFAAVVLAAAAIVVALIRGCKPRSSDPERSEGSDLARPTDFRRHIPPASPRSGRETSRSSSAARHRS